MPGLGSVAKIEVPLLKGLGLQVCSWAMRQSDEWITDFSVVFCECLDFVSSIEWFESLVSCAMLDILFRVTVLLLFSRIEVRALEIIGIDAARWFIAWFESAIQFMDQVSCSSSPRDIPG